MHYNKFWLQPFAPPLPTVFSEELSYLEQVKKVQHLYFDLHREMHSGFQNIGYYIDNIEKDLAKLKQIFLTHEDTVLKAATAYTDANIKIVNNKIADMDKRLTSQITAVNTSLQRQINDNFLILMARIQQNYDNVNKELENINNKVNYTLEQSYSYTDNKVSELNEKLTKLRGDIATQITDFQGQLDIFQTNYEKWMSDYGLFKQDVNNLINERIDKAIEILTEHVATLNGDLILVTSPKTGKIGTLKNVLAEVYSGLWWAKISAKEYDNMKLNASAYDSRKIKALDYDTHARFVFFNELYMKNWWLALQKYQEEFLNAIQEINKKLTMRNPITGRISDMKDVIYDIVEKLHNEFKLTANEYDHLKLQAAAYDAMQLTAFDYDFYAKKHLGQQFISVKP